MNEVNNLQEQFEFKAEMKQLLHLIIHSLYTHPEVFIRELVSNSSDALNKIRFRTLSESEILNPELELNIKIEIDKENKTFSIEDSGIGMTKDELINQLGTIASSGTLKFLNSIKEQGKQIDANMIGQFGVGFYSVYMVTDEITVESKHSDIGSTAFKWTSNGESTFTIEEIQKETRGTKISFKLKDDYSEFADDFRVKSILKKYSNFVDFPILVNNEVVNKVTALWHRKKEDVSNEELNEFYKFISNDYQEPMGHIQLAIEGNINFKALIFIPETAPMSLFRDTQEKSLHLYSNKVFIQDDAKELVPEYLKFLKGVVDSEDLPLNVSREVTQSSPLMVKIKNVITSKILGLLEEWATNDVEKYNKFFKNFGSLFKTGVNSDYSNRSKIIELLRFESSSVAAGDFTSFNGYVSRMKPDQTEIYYVSGNFRDQIEKNPNLEYFQKNNIEVIYLTDPVDIFTIPYLMEYDNKKIISIDKAEIKQSETEEKAEEKVNPDTKASLIAEFKTILGDKVEDVIESKRLVSSVATLVVGQQGMDPQMEKMMQMMDKEFTGSKRILEINTNHELFNNLAEIYQNDKNNVLIKNSILQIFEGSLLLEGIMKSPSEFVERMTNIMVKATKV